MELKLFLKVFADQKQLFFVLLFLPLSLMLISTYFLLPQKYDAVVTLILVRNVNISEQLATQQEVLQAKDEYDSFYRFNADEKMTQTVVELLSAPKVVEDILTGSGVASQTAHYSVSELRDFFDTKKMSPHIVEVVYQAHSSDAARKLSAPISTILTKNIKELSSSYDASQAFTVVAKEPVVRLHTHNYLLLSIGSLFVGFSTAILVCLLRFYLKEE